MTSKKKQSPADAPPAADNSKNIQPTYTAQRFLSVHVPKGSSSAQIADAVSKALRSQDVPYFKDRKLSTSPGQPTAPQAAAGSARVAVNGGGASGNLNSSEGLLILVQQEGGP